MKLAARLRRVYIVRSMDEDSNGVVRWRTHAERALHDDVWMRVAQVDVELPDGTRRWHDVIRLRPAASAVVVDDSGRVLLLKRHRFVPDVVGWEVPGGVIDPGETGAMAAVRETEEETGWRPLGAAVRLCAFEPMPGMVSARHEVYLVHGAEHVGKPHDPDEAGRVEWHSLDHVASLLSRGDVMGSASLVGLLSLFASAAPGIDFSGRG